MDRQSIVLVVIIVLAAGLSAPRAILEPAMPPVSGNVVTGGRPELAPATLWEDPLGAVRRHAASMQAERAQAVAAGELDARGNRYWEPLWADVESIVARTSTDDESDEASEDHAAHPRLLLLPVLTSGLEDPLSTESRRQLRSAVQQALAEFGFVPRERAGIGYVAWDAGEDARDPSAAARARSPNGDAEAPDDQAMLVPYEWFDHAEPPEPTGPGALGDERYQRRTEYDTVLLFWVWTERFRTDDRIPALAQLVTRILATSDGSPPEQAAPSGELDGARSVLLVGLREDAAAAVVAEDPVLRFKGIADVKVLGPSSAETLAEIITAGTLADQGAGATRSKTFELDWTFVSYSATLERERLADNVRRQIEDKIPAGEILPRVPRVDLFKRSQVGPFEISRVIESDDHLIRLLVSELGNRGIVPGRNASVAIISPWDSAYARAMAEKLVGAGGGSGGDYAVVTYMPRLTADLAPQDQTEQSGRSLDRLLGTTPRHRPAGATQLDAVERMVDEMVKLAEQREHAGLPIRAIALLGGGQYDKLTILRALSGKLPNAIRLTTDLHAIYAHPAEQEHTRGMLVASSFGLRLGDALQARTPPFRSSYDTAAFFATQVALQPELLDDAVYSPDQPISRVFEIGRTGPHDLGGALQPGLAKLLHPVPPRERGYLRLQWGAGVLLSLAALTAFLSLAGHTIRLWPESVGGRPKLHAEYLPGWGYVKSRALTALVLLFVGPVLGYVVAALIAANRAESEPFEWFEGISAWPGIVIRWLIVCLGLGFGVLMFRQLRRSVVRLRRDLKLPSVAGLDLHDPIASAAAQAFGAPAEGDGTNRNPAAPDRRSASSLLRDLPRVAWAVLAGPQARGFLLAAVGLVTIGVVLLDVNRATTRYPLWVMLGYAVAGSAILGAILFGGLVIGRIRNRSTRVFHNPDVESPSTLAEVDAADWWDDKRCAPNGKPGVVWGERLWQAYLRAGRPIARAQRVTMMVAIAMLLTVGCLLLFPQVGHGIRGDFTQFVHFATWILSAVIFFVFNFAVWDACRLCKWLIERLSTWPTQWRTQTIEEAADEARVAGSRWQVRAGLAELVDVLLIGRRTEAVISTIYFPAILLAIMLVSASDVFDRWTWSVASIIVVVTGALVMVVSATAVRRAAMRAKERALERVDELIERSARGLLPEGDVEAEDVHAPPRPPSQVEGKGPVVEMPIATDMNTSVDGDGTATMTEPRTSTRAASSAAGREEPSAEVTESLQAIRKRIEACNEGAYGKFSENPVIRAVLLPFSSLGVVEILRVLLIGG